MTGINRLPEPFGSQVQANTVIQFQFDGREYTGMQGDTVASALAANDQWLLSRSFKYHRPRGALTMAGQDANTLVQLPADPNALADVVEIEDGLRVSAQNFIGSLTSDRLAFIEYFSRFLPVGFYYKAFFRPRGIWEKWARFFRSKAGLGVVDESCIARDYDKQYKFCDVLVVGAGAAGLTAAIEAGRRGLNVILVDENAALGGALNYTRLDSGGSRAAQLREQLVSETLSVENIEVMTRAIVNGWFADNWVPIVRGKRLFKVRAAEVILCTGALPQLAVFRNNDLPGIMMTSAASRLMHLYGVRPGRNAVILTSNDEGYACALDLLDAGVKIRALVDMRRNAGETPLTQAVRAKGVPITESSAIYSARRSGNHLAAVEVREVVAQGRLSETGNQISCDLLCMSVGHMPAYQLACQAGATLDYHDNSSQFSISNLPAHLQIAGMVHGYADMDAAIKDAKRAAVIAANSVGNTNEEIPLTDNGATPSETVNFDWPMFAHPKGKEFVDLDEDLQMADIINATHDGYEHIQLVKRYSTCGMGPSQGRHSALPAARLVANETGRTIGETGVTTARPPFAAEKLAHCAGRSFYPARRSNMHYRHVEAGATMLQIGNWYRPAHYGDDKRTAVESEAQAVRNDVGIIDVSTLGGIEVRGPDAAQFLNRIYTFAFLKQPVGRARYALMTNEAGVVIDDGVACRMSDDHFYVTATTGGVDRVYQSMLKWNAQWRMQVDLANVTSAYCAVNIAGPKSRQVLQRLCPDTDLSSEAFPYMGVRTATVAGIPARLLRVGFVGELGFEIHAPQHAGEALWDALLDGGQEEGIRPFGVEAQRLLRLEKGHIIIGQDTDAMSSPAEVAMSWAIAARKPFFVGNRSIRDLAARPQKRALVGFEIRCSAAPVPKECHLVLSDERMVGRVTSSAWSPALQRTIGLAYVPADQTAPGTSIEIRTDGGVMVSATIVPTPFYDPDNKRQDL